MTRRLMGTAYVAMLAVLFGCGSTKINTYSKPAVGQRQYGKVKKVAVLPFDTVVEGAQAPRIAGNFFYQELLHAGTFEDLEEPRYVAELMKKLKLRNTENLDREIVRKIGEELQAQALVLGDLMLFGMEEDSEIVEFSLQINLVDVDSGDILWSGRSFASSSTTWGEILGVNQGPSANQVAKRGVQSIVAKLDGEFRDAREKEVERMLEAARAEEMAPEAALPAEGEQVAPLEGEQAPPPEDQAEEILLEVKPK